MRTSAEYIVSSNPPMVIKRFEGRVDINIIKKAAYAIWEDENYDIYMKELIDLRGCTFDTRLSEITKLAIFLLKNNNTSKGFIALLIDSKEGIAKSLILNSKVSRLMNMHVVTDLNEALRNLGISEEIYEKVSSQKINKIW